MACGNFSKDETGDLYASGASGKAGDPRGLSGRVLYDAAWSSCSCSQELLAASKCQQHRDEKTL